MKQIFLSALIVATAVAPAAGADPVASSMEPTTVDQRRAPEVSVVGLSYARGRFQVDIEVSRTIVDHSGYLVAQLFYRPPEGAGVSPFSATAIDDVSFRPAGPGRVSATLVVAGPEPADIRDVNAVVSANPTPYP